MMRQSAVTAAPDGAAAPFHHLPFSSLMMPLVVPGAASRRSTPPSAAPLRRALRLAATSVAAALAMACADAAPAGPGDTPDDVTPASAAVSCAVDISGGLAGCGSPGGARTSATAGAAARHVSLRTIGGQNVNIRFEQVSFTFDPVSRILTSNVRLTNLMTQPLGTPDGTTPDPQGIQVFFHVPPTNGVEVVNENGTGTFTGTGQPFFAYPAPLAPGASATETWQFHLPDGVPAFTFQLLIEADMPGDGTTPVATLPLVINEVMSDPASVDDAVGEWFEVYNPNAAAVNMQGYVIASNNDSRTYTVTSLSVPARGFVVFGNSADRTANGNVPVDQSYGTAIVLANGSTDWIELRKPTGTGTFTVEDRVDWGVAQTSGRSRGVLDPAADNSLMSGPNWALATTQYNSAVVNGTTRTDRGTPKAANDAAVVTPPAGPVTTVTVTPTDPTNTLGTTRQFTATGRDANGATSSTTFSWTSSDETVATISQSGLATTAGQGQTTITARSANGISGSTTLTVTAGTSTTAIYRNHLEYGTPTDADQSDDIFLPAAQPGGVPQFALSYNKNRGGPNWVSWNLNETHFGPAPRCDCWHPDSRLPSDVYHVLDSDYTGNMVYSRGHMVTSEERTTTSEENRSTFLMTNALPQYQALNGGPWLKLETYMQLLAQQQHKEMYVIAGGIFGPNPPTLKNEGKVAAPDSTWKIVVIQNFGEGLANVTSAASIQVIAVNMPNVSSFPSGTPWENYRTTVDAIERSTGYDFLSALPDAIEAEVEARPSALAASWAQIVWTTPAPRAASAPPAPAARARARVQR